MTSSKKPLTQAELFDYATRKTRELYTTTNQLSLLVRTLDNGKGGIAVGAAVEREFRGTLVAIAHLWDALENRLADLNNNKRTAA